MYYKNNNDNEKKSNDELKETYIKNCINYYFDHIIKSENFDFDNILLDEKSQESILIYNISYKTLFGAKPLCNRFNNVDGYITVDNGNGYLTLIGPEKYDTIYNKIRYLISLKSSITYVFCHN